MSTYSNKPHLFFSAYAFRHRVLLKWSISKLLGFPGAGQCLNTPASYPDLWSKLQLCEEAQCILKSNSCFVRVSKKYHLTKQSMSLRDCCWGCFHRSSSTPAVYFYTCLQPFSLHPTGANQPDMKGDQLAAAAILMKTPHLCTNHLFHGTPCWVI